MSMQTAPAPVPATAVSRRAFMSGAIAAASMAVSATPLVALTDAAFEAEQDMLVERFMSIVRQMPQDEKIRLLTFMKWRLRDGRRETCPDAVMLAWMDEHA